MHPYHQFCMHVQYTSVATGSGNAGHLGPDIPDPDLIFGGDFNLAVWRFFVRPLNLNDANIASKLLYV